MGLKRIDDTVFIEGLRGFGPEEYASSVHGTQARILQTLKEPLSYDDLVSYSGFSFRAAVSERMCPSAAHPCCGFPCIDNGTRAIPWKMRLFENLPWEDGKPDPEAFREDVCTAVRESIDRGIPVHYGSEEDGLIFGYGKEGRRWKCFHPYHEWGREAFWYDEAEGFAGGRWPWAVVVWTGRREPEELTPYDELLKSALAQAVEMWSAPEVGDQYLCGGEAYDFWIGWLQDIDEGGVEDPVSGMQGNGWYFDVLVHSRGIAGRWLAARADDVPEGAAEPLRSAAGLYSRMASELAGGLDCSWDLAPPPERYGQWTAEMRREQVSRLCRARELDGEAVALVREALSLMGPSESRGSLS